MSEIVKLGRRCQLIIPKNIREEVNIDEGDNVIIDVVDGTVVLRPAPKKMGELSGISRGLYEKKISKPKKNFMRTIPKIFLDTNIIIYFFEKDEYFYDKIIPFFKDAEQDQARLFSSSLSYMEIEMKYNFLFKRLFKVIDIDTKVARLAATIRDKYKTNTSDSIQIACAIHAGCNRFVTSDKKFKGLEGIDVLIIE